MYLFFATLAIVGLAALAGVMASIGFVLGPYWLALPLHLFQPIFRSTGQSILQLLPFLLVPTTIGLVGVNWMCWNSCGMNRSLWCFATLCLVMTMLVTKFWFFPQNDRLLAAEMQASDLPRMMSTWLQFHLSRIALPLAASIAGIAGLSLK